MRVLEPDTAMAAVISEDGLYRYELKRRWSDHGTQALCWVMLNPSTADGTRDDPTIRRVIGFSKLWGWSGIVVVNLFALRATDPRRLLTHPDPVGPENDERGGFWIRHLPTIVAWGASTMARQRVAWIREQAERSQYPLRCLGTTRDGSPRHPLFVRSSTQPVEW